MSEIKISDQQIRFCKEYLLDFNATRAAIAAGYSEKAARSVASRLLTKANIQAKIKELQEIEEERSKLKKEDIIAELRKIAFQDVRNLFDKDQQGLRRIEDLDDATAASVASIETVAKTFQGVPYEYVKKIKMWDKRAALETLGRHFGLWVDKVQHSGPEGKAIPLEFKKMDLAQFTDEEVDELARILEASEARKRNT